VRLLELADHAHKLFQKQEPHEKRRLINFLLSNCTWEGGELQAVFRQPFDMVAVLNFTSEKQKAAGVASNGLFENWLLG